MRHWTCSALFRYKLLEFFSSLLGVRDVGGIIQRGGTMLGSKRYPEFKAGETQLKAI